MGQRYTENNSVKWFEFGFEIWFTRYKEFVSKPRNALCNCYAFFVSFWPIGNWLIRTGAESEPRENVVKTNLDQFRWLMTIVGVAFDLVSIKLREELCTGSVTIPNALKDSFMAKIERFSGYHASKAGGNLKPEILS